ncbi:iron-sulfur cluster-binding protein [Desulfovulcanus sp.]
MQVQTPQNSANAANANSCLDLKVKEITFSCSSDFCHLYLEPPDWQFTPGQFVMLRPVSWDKDPLWPRPFSICELTNDYLHIFFQVVGRGTELLSFLSKDDIITVWGPLGRGFSIEPNQDQQLLILAGGMGIAPFIGLTRTFPRPERLNFLFGHRLDISCYPFHLIPEQVQKEHKQQESEQDLKYFEQYLRDRIQNFASKGTILACGPYPFLKVVHNCALKFNARVQISLENKMACGIGACLGCVSKNKNDEYIQTCTHGPVFWADEIKI